MACFGPHSLVEPINFHASSLTHQSTKNTRPFKSKSEIFHGACNAITFPKNAVSGQKFTLRSNTLYYYPFMSSIGFCSTHSQPNKFFFNFISGRGCHPR